MLIRPENENDIEVIRDINSEAFETNTEANLVDKLRESGIPFISLVAEIDNKLVGHILFTPVKLVGETREIKIAGLAPMAVLPNLQNNGIGSKLVEDGLKQCKDEDFEAVVVLGHPNYYPKFGFIPSVKFDIKSEYDVPDEVFMIKELNANSLKGQSGIIKYHDNSIRFNYFSVLKPQTTVHRLQPKH